MCVWFWFLSGYFYAPTFWLGTYMHRACVCISACFPGYRFCCARICFAPPLYLACVAARLCVAFFGLCGWLFCAAISLWAAISVAGGDHFCCFATFFVAMLTVVPSLGKRLYPNVFDSIRKRFIIRWCPSNVGARPADGPMLTCTRWRNVRFWVYMRWVISCLISGSRLGLHHRLSTKPRISDRLLTEPRFLTQFASSCSKSCPIGKQPGPTRCDNNVRLTT